MPSPVALILSWVLCSVTQGPSLCEGDSCSRSSFCLTHVNQLLHSGTHQETWVEGDRRKSSWAPSLKVTSSRTLEFLSSYFGVGSCDEASGIGQAFLCGFTMAVHSVQSDICLHSLEWAVFHSNTSQNEGWVAGLSRWGQIRTQLASFSGQTYQRTTVG